MVKQGIDRQLKHVVFARTAMEIKSSVGATPQNYICYIRHENLILNQLVPFLVKYVGPNNEWTPRNPLKMEWTLKSIA